MPLPPLFLACARRSAAWLALLLAVPCAAVAGAGASAAAPTDSQAVRNVALLAGTCTNCHGPDGRAPQGSSIPSLRGQRAEHLQQRLAAFQAGTAPDATVMIRLMKGYDAAQIQALAQWFAAKEAP